MTEDLQGKHLSYWAKSAAPSMSNLNHLFHSILSHRYHFRKTEGIRNISIIVRYKNVWYLETSYFVWIKWV